MGGTSGPPPPTTTTTTTNGTNTIVGQNSSFSGTYSSSALTSINSKLITLNGSLTIIDSLINLAPPSGLTNEVNSGIYIDINTTSTSKTKYSGLIRQNNTENILGSSYWYLFDSNGINTSGDCPKLTTDNAVGAILQVGTVLSTSDERLKVNIETIENTLESISNLRGVRYDWKDGHGKREVGVIAQELRTEYPELVFEDNLGFLTVDYPKLTAVLIEGIKEMKKDMDTIKESLKRKPRQNKKNKEMEKEPRVKKV